MTKCVRKKLKEDIRMIYRMHDLHILQNYCLILCQTISWFTVPEFFLIQYKATHTRHQFKFLSRIKIIGY